MKTAFTSTLLFVCLFFLQAQNPQKITIELGGYDREYLPRMENRPVELQGRIFDKLFRAAEIARFTPKEMEKYNKSILEYSDVRSAMECARGEGFEKGIIFIARKCLAKNMPIEDIADLTGLSKEQILKEKEK